MRSLSVACAKSCESGHAEVQPVSAVLAVEIPYWGQSLLRVLGGIVAVLLPAGTIVYLFLFKMMSFMQSRLGPMEAGPYGSLQLVRRGRQVAAEGGHRAGGGRPPHLQDGPADRAGVDVPARRRRAVRSRRLADQLRGRRVLRPRRVVDQRARHPRRRLGERQQVLAARRPARRRPADRLRAAARAGDHRRRHAGRLDEHAGHRRRPEHRVHLRLGRPRQPVRPHAVHRLRRVHDRRPGRADAAPVRHADRRVRAGVGLHDRVLGLPLPDLLHRRVRHRRCLLADRLGAVPRRVGRAVRLVRVGQPRRASTTG